MCLYVNILRIKNNKCSIVKILFIIIIIIIFSQNILETGMVVNCNSQSGFGFEYGCVFPRDVGLFPKYNYLLLLYMTCGS